MDHSITKRMQLVEAEAYCQQYRDSTQQANGRFLHFTSPEEWNRHKQEVVEAQKVAPF